MHVAQVCSEFQQCAMSSLQLCAPFTHQSWLVSRSNRNLMEYVYYISQIDRARFLPHYPWLFSLSLPFLP